MEIEYQEKWKYLSEACLNITDDCNLACHYCFVQQQPHYMDLQTAKNAVDWLWTNAQIKIKNHWENQNYCPHINFFGGEPTLMWDKIIVPLTEYIREKYQDKFAIGMTTNGTLLNEQRIDFMKKNQIGILLSIDGDRETQELTRPCKNCNQSSFDLVVKNIPLILNYIPKVTFRATINQENVAYMFHNYLFAEKMGFHEFYFSPNEREKWTQENLQILGEQVEKIFYHNLIYYNFNIMPKMSSSLIDDGYKHVLTYYYNLNKNKTIIKNNKNLTINRCGLGTNYGSINYEGKIFSCQEQDSRTGSNSIFEIGDIYNGINIDKQLNLINLYLNADNKYCENINLCKTCKIYDTCSVDCCPSTTLDIYNNLNIKSEVLCYYRNSYANNAFVNFNLLQENKVFQQYLQQLMNNKEGGRTYNGYK